MRYYETKENGTSYSYDEHEAPAVWLMNIIVVVVVLFVIYLTR